MILHKGTLLEPWCEDDKKVSVYYGAPGTGAAAGKPREGWAEIYSRQLGLAPPLHCATLLRMSLRHLASDGDQGWVSGAWSHHLLAPSHWVGPGLAC